MRYFYPRPPRGGRRPARISTNWSWTFLSTPSARRATITDKQTHATAKISIHALREEGDLWPPFHASIILHFYPRPPRGGRPPAAWERAASSLFLSTPSARRATLIVEATKGKKTISIHALREEGDKDHAALGKVPAHISIHALREEGDCWEVPRRRSRP